MKKNSSLKLATLAFMMAGTVNAASLPATNTRMIIAPTCLLQKINAPYQTLATSNQLSLIQTGTDAVKQLITAKQKHGKIPCGGFNDVTYRWQQSQSNQQNAMAFLQHYSVKKITLQKKISYGIHYPDQVNTLLKQINPTRMWNYLDILTQYDDRSAETDTGVAASNMIKDEIEAIAKQNNRDDVTVTLVATGQYPQPSVVVKIGNSDEPGVVIGSHMDTLASSWWYGLMPGADDDGSGSATTLEAANTILSSGMHFKKPIYFIWYAAEEEGLIGSSYVVADFKNKKIPVDAVIQFDLTGYAYQNDPTMYLITDFVSPGLTDYLEKLITTYVKQPVHHTQCGYACSDHASWTLDGYAAAIPAEAAFKNTNPDIHYSSDTMDKLSISHMTDYAKLAVAFAVELAEPLPA